MPETIALLTTSRAEYYQMRPVLRALASSTLLKPLLLVSGSHLSATFGDSRKDIAADGFEAIETLPIMVDVDSRYGGCLTAGLAVQQVAGALQRQTPDLLLLMGDRYEIAAAALAATILEIPIAHVHGGECTTGAIDDRCRHAITKMSALHFTSTTVYAERVHQMGEARERIFAVGAPLVDNLLSVELLTEAAWRHELGIDIEPPTALVAYHPETVGDHDAEARCQRVLAAIGESCKTVIITAPNHDPGNHAIRDAMTAFADTHTNAHIYSNLGSRLFLTSIKHADIMIGNSSSGIHEAASFGTPVVNVGDRQTGRLKPRNVVDAAPLTEALHTAIHTALSDAFRRSLEGLANPYGSGEAGAEIVRILERHIPFAEKLAPAPFADGAAVAAATREWTTHHG